MTFQASSAVLVEDVETLFGEMRRLGISCARRLKCIYPEDCGTNAATDCLLPGRDKDGRVVVVSGGKILIFDPRARDQRGFLLGRVKLKARDIRARCAECKRAGVVCPLAEDMSDAYEDGERTGRKVVASPVSPLDTYTMLELVNKGLALMPDEEHRQMLKWYIAGFSEAEIARRQNKIPATVRKRMERARERIARALKINL